MKCVDLATFFFATWQIRSCLPCKFISLGAGLLVFRIFLVFLVKEVNRRALLLKQVQRSEGKWNICKLSKERVKTCNDYVIGREIPYHHTTDGREEGCCSFHFRCMINKIVFTTPEKRRCLVCWQFCVDFLRIYVIEVNSLAVWSKRVKRFKGKLIIFRGKQELARTCSVYISVNLWLCDGCDYYLLLCLYFTHST